MRSFLVLIVTISILAIISARPNQQNINKNSITKVGGNNEDVQGNDTEIRGKESKNAIIKNSDMTKAIDEDYEYEEYYDDPIIVIRFKRDDAVKKDVGNDQFKNKVEEKNLSRLYIRWLQKRNIAN